MVLEFIHEKICKCAWCKKDTTIEEITAIQTEGGEKVFLCADCQEEARELSREQHPDMEYELSMTEDMGQPDPMDLTSKQEDLILARENE